MNYATTYNSRHNTDDLEKLLRRYSFCNSSGITTPKQKAMDLIKRVIFNDPATIVIWSDGTKTVVKCDDRDEFDPEKGLAMAICKKHFGGGFYNDIFRKWIPKETEEDSQLTLDNIVEKFIRLGSVTNILLGPTEE